MIHIRMVAALVLTVSPAALWAQDVTANAKIQSVTLFPWGAQVVRQVNVSAEKPQQIIVPGLPEDTRIDTLRVAGEGLQIGALSLIDDRRPPSDGAEDPAVVSAKAEVDRLEDVLADKLEDVAQIRLQALAAQDRVQFLSGLSTQGMDAAQALSLAQQVAEESLAARTTALKAEAAARRADDALAPDRKALESARQTLAAVQNPSDDGDVLRATVQGTGVMTITTYVDNAGWSPSYDMHLDRASGQVTLDRYVSVHQASGEDWQGVDVTLSTARPSERADPTYLPPLLRRSGPPVELMAAPKALARSADMAMMEAPVAEGMGAQMQGMVLTYHYAQPVDIRDGVEALRLSLDQMTLPADIRAQAVPVFDDRAYLMAEIKNGTEILLPGPVTRYVDGAMVGGGQLDLVAAGDTFDLGFGAIDGLTLSHVVEDRIQGQAGLISKSSQQSETTRIEVKNLTNETWPMRVLDRVPYSEQDSLKITYSADPAPTTEHPDDRRGVLVWDFDLPPQDSQLIRVQTDLNWPDDEVLR
ncbi:hypothetical protein BFP70_01025 [Thioclava sp. SK-1]|uniref:DUF4139 domain-containing protein n=1 Tax=Thioclava sp. SK-1 TaxID=1889770 RepID=UPI0008257782|nr:DUF4139 domain-containing protein [Thioclava sp. SK-1]OCX66768.1 hypothetical protein BFP70_01025 [Thioclava sp. SK-1]